MNKVVFYKAKDGLIGFQMNGHAGYRKSGPDIVCAALSVLSQNTVFSVVKLTGFIESDLELIDDESKPMYGMMLPNLDDEKANLLMKSFELGVEIMAKTYPNNVKLVYRRCSDEDDI